MTFTLDPPGDRRGPFASDPRIVDLAEHRAFWALVRVEMDDIMSSPGFKDQHPPEYEEET